MNGQRWVSFASVLNSSDVRAVGVSDIVAARDVPALVDGPAMITDRIPIRGVDRKGGFEHPYLSLRLRPCVAMEPLRGGVRGRWRNPLCSIRWLLATRVTPGRRFIWFLGNGSLSSSVIFCNWHGVR